MLPVADLARTAVNASAIPAAAAATIPVWGPSAVRLFGIDIPIGTMAVAMIGLGAARAVSAAREGAAPGGRWLTATLCMILFGCVVEFRPGVGPAIALGVGIGASGILVVDVLKNRVKGVLEALLGRTGPPAPPSP